MVQRSGSGSPRRSVSGLDKGKQPASPPYTLATPSGQQAQGQPKPDDNCRTILAQTTVVPGTLPTGDGQAALGSSSSSLSSQRSWGELSVSQQSVEASSLSALATSRAEALNWLSGLDSELKQVGLAKTSLASYELYYRAARNLARTLHEQNPDRIQLTLVGEESLYTWLYLMKLKAQSSKGRPRPIIKQISATASLIADLLGTAKPCDFPLFQKVKKTLASKFTTQPIGVKGRIEYAQFIPLFKKHFPRSIETTPDRLRTKAMTLVCIVRACRPSDLAAMTRSLDINQMFRQDPATGLKYAVIISLNFKNDYKNAGHIAMTWEASDPDICPVRVLRRYVEQTQKLANAFASSHPGETIPLFFHEKQPQKLATGTITTKLSQVFTGYPDKDSMGHTISPGSFRSSTRQQLLLCGAPTWLIDLVAKWGLSMVQRHYGNATVPSDFSNCALALKNRLIFDPPAVVPGTVSSEIDSLIRRDFIDNDTDSHLPTSPVESASSDQDETPTIDRESRSDTLARIRELERTIAAEDPLDPSAPELQNDWGIDLSDEDTSPVSSHISHSSGNGGHPSAVPTNVDLPILTTQPEAEPSVASSQEMSLSKQFQVPVLGKRTRRANQRFINADTEAPSRKRRKGFISNEAPSEPKHPFGLQ